MKKILGSFAVLVAVVAGFAISHGAPVLPPSLLTFGANGTVTPTVGHCLNILAMGSAGVTSTDAGTPCFLPGTTIAALPTCNSAAQGLRSYVTNGQATPTYLGAVSTTGTVVAPVFCNGTGWVYY